MGNNDSFSNELFVMDVKENGNNRPKPLNPTVIGSSLRERMRASCRKWREKNKQRCHEYFRNYRQKRKELAMWMQESKKELGEKKRKSSVKPEVSGVRRTGRNVDNMSAITISKPKAPTSRLIYLKS